jgi:hypothetical protein
VRPVVVVTPRRPIAVTRLIVRAVILVVLLGVAAVRFAMMPKGSSLTAGIPLPVIGISNAQWEGVHGAILADVNGDSVPDILGRSRYVIGGDRVTLAAFDGASGAKLWESDALGTYSQTYQGALGFADDVLLFATPNGELRAFGAHDGKKRWTSSLPEKAAEFCKGDRPGEVRVRLADKASAHIRLADGQAAAAAAPRSASPSATAPPPPPGAHGARPRDAKEADTCLRVASDDAKAGDPAYEVRSVSFVDVKVDGMSVRTMVRRGDGPKIVVGARDKGTSVPMIAAVFDDASRNWKSDLAGTRPLETGPFPPETLAVTASRAFTEYGFTDSSKPHALVAFDLGGHRQWETPLPGRDPISSVQATDARVFVSQWGRLSVYDAATGKAAFSIGKP